MDSGPSPVVSTASFANLPEDVGRIVFELLAQDSTRDGLACALTSECFYRTIDAPTSTKPPHFFTRRVKVLVVNFNTKPEHIVAFLSKCTGIKTLACWLTTPAASTLVWDTMKSLPGLLTQFSIRLDPLPDGVRDFSFTIFRNLTHLEIVSVNGAEWSWASLADLKHLTHLSLDIPWNISRRLLKLTREILGSSCPPNLRVFVVFFSGTDGTLPGPPPKDLDTRVVFATGDEEGDEGYPPADDMIVRSVDDLVTDWAGRPVGTDFWTQAEQIIRRRQLAAQKKAEIAIPDHAGLRIELPNGT
ncbi:hypothetical protein H1R20_g5633, partial [Candolleomyces eurysporus]